MKKVLSDSIEVLFVIFLTMFLVGAGIYITSHEKQPQESKEAKKECAAVKPKFHRGQKVIPIYRSDW